MRAAVMTEFNAPLRVEEIGPDVHAVAPGDRVVCTWTTAWGVGLAAIERGEVIRSVIVN
jgi:NADPH:quinone reductase-like Zn-dependent oxidoreductase